MWELKGCAVLFVSHCIWIGVRIMFGVASYIKVSPYATREFMICDIGNFATIISWSLVKVELMWEGKDPCLPSVWEGQALAARILSLPSERIEISILALKCYQTITKHFILSKGRVKHLPLPEALALGREGGREALVTSSLPPIKKTMS